MRATTRIAMFLASLMTVMGAFSTLAQSMEIKVGSYEPEGHFLVQNVYIPYFEEIERRTNGELTFKWYHAGTLVKAPQSVEALLGGLVDVMVTTAIFTQQSRFPVSEVMTLPFLFDSTVQADLVYKKAYETIPEFRAEHEGLVALGFHVSDFFNIHMHKDNVHVKTLEDMEGLEIAAVSKGVIDVTEALGATPRSIKPADIYVSMQRGAVDGTFFPTAPLAKWKMTDLSNKHTLVYGPFVMIPMMMSEKTWNKLSPEAQAVFNDMSGSLTNFAGAIVDNRRESTLSKVRDRGDDIYILPDEEKARWVEATKPLYDRWLNSMSEKGIDGEAILAKVREYAEEFRGAEYQQSEWWGDDWQE